MILHRAGSIVGCETQTKNCSAPDIYRLFTCGLLHRVSIKTKALSLIDLDPPHQAHIDRILKLHQDGLNSRQIADHLNDLGITSWTGKRFYLELVFGLVK